MARRSLTVRPRSSSCSVPLPDQHSRRQLAFPPKGNVARFEGEPLELAFRALWLRHVCEDFAKAEAQFGRRVAESLVRRLADLRAAPAVFDLPFEWEPTIQTNKPGFKVWIIDHSRMVWIVNHQQVPRTESTIDWSRVRRIQLDSIKGVNE